MIEFKIHVVQSKTRKIKEIRFYPPNDREYYMEQDPELRHLWRVKVKSDAALISADPNERMPQLMDTLKTKWFGSELRTFIMYLVQASDIRVKHVQSQFGKILGDRKLVEEVLNYMVKYGALTFGFHGSFRRTVELNIWLKEFYTLYADDVGPTPPSVPLDRVTKLAEREKTRKKSQEEIQAMTKDELYEYIQMRKEAKAKQSEIERLNKWFQYIRSQDESVDGL